MSGDLSGKVAVITGGASGIGKATAELFVAEGAQVVIADLNVEAGEALAKALGNAAVFQRTDVSDEVDMEALAQRATSAFGGLDVLFNNAGMSTKPYPSFLDDKLDDFDRVMRVNVLGPMLGTRNAARIMAKRGGGAIINNASIAGTLAGLGMMTYRASKAALIQFSKSSAIDLARHGIRVNCIVPGHVRTELSSFGEKGVDAGVAARIEEGVNAVYLSNQLIKRRGDPIDVANVALFLAGEKSRHMTGTVIPVEGGVTVGDPVNHLQDILDARNAALAPAEAGQG